MKNPDIPVVIPAYEPDQQLTELCTALTGAGITNVVVVDDGSGADYEHIFKAVQEEFGFTLLTHRENKGKGRALKDAFAHILQHQPQAVGCVTADSDGQHSPEDILACMQALNQNPDCLVLGCRDFTGENVPDKSRFGNNLTKKVFAYLCGLEISDTQTGLRGIPRGYMEFLQGVKGERFEFETNMLIQASKRIRVVEVPIRTIYDSKEDHKTHFDPVRDSIRIYKNFAALFFKYILSSLSSSVLDLVLFALFCGLFQQSFPVAYILIATVLARVLSATYNCLVNYFLVFKTDPGRKPVRRSVMQYFLLAAAQMLASAAGVTALVFLTQHFVPDTLIKILVDVSLFFVSYRIQQKYIF